MREGLRHRTQERYRFYISPWKRFGYGYFPLSVGLIFACFWLLLTPSSSQASGLFRIIDRNYGSVPVDYQAILDGIFNQLEDQVNSELPSTGAGTPYLEGVSNSGALAGAGVGPDYASPFSWGELGVSVGFGAQVNGTSLSPDVDLSKVSGASAQGGVVLGINPGLFFGGYSWLHRTRLFLFTNFNMNQSWPSGSGSHSTQTLSGAFNTTGVFIQYKLLAPRYSWGRSLRWGGLDLTTGYRSTEIKLLFSNQISETLAPTTVDLPVPTTVTGSFDGDIDVGFQSSLQTIPLELSSSVRLGYLFNIYLGVGCDFNSGSTSATTSFSGPVSMTTSPSVGNISGTAILDMGQNGSPDSVVGRSFLGFQFDLGLGGLFVQRNTSWDRKVDGYSAGLRLYW